MSRPSLLRQLVNAVTGGELASPAGLLAGQNYIMNSNFDIFQRGNVFVNPGNQTYTADRWQVAYDGSGGSFGITQNGLTPGVIPTSAAYYMQVNQTGAASGQTFMRLYYHLENVYSFAGQIITLSFYAGTDISRNLGVTFAQNFGSGGSGDVFTPTQIFTTAPASGFTLHTLTFQMPSIFGKTIGTNHFIYFYIDLPINTTYSFSITSLMLNQGNFPAPHSLMGRDVGGELHLCQRYYEVSEGTNVMMTGNGNGGAGYSEVVQFKVTKRVNPSITVASSWSLTDKNGTGSTSSGGVWSNNLQGFSLQFSSFVNTGSFYAYNTATPAWSASAEF